MHTRTSRPTALLAHVLRCCALDKSVRNPPRRQRHPGPGGAAHDPLRSSGASIARKHSRSLVCPPSALEGGQAPNTLLGPSTCPCFAGEKPHRRAARSACCLVPGCGPAIKLLTSMLCAGLETLRAIYQGTCGLADTPQSSGRRHRHTKQSSSGTAAPCAAAGRDVTEIAFCATSVVRVVQSMCGTTPRSRTNQMQQGPRHTRLWAACRKNTCVVRHPRALQGVLERGPRQR